MVTVDNSELPVVCVASIPLVVHRPDKGDNDRYLVTRLRVGANEAGVSNNCLQS